MEIIHIGDANVVVKAADVLRRGGIILYPTDTLYGLGADALSNEAVAKIYTIKGRDDAKPMHAIVASIEDAAKYGDMHEKAFALACAYLPGPLTLILKKKAGIDSGIARNRDSFGFRIPDNQFCIDLARAFGGPYTTTSANISGSATGRSITEICDQLGKKAETIDLIIDAGELPEKKPSTVVDVSSEITKVLREGAIPASAFEIQ